MERLDREYRADKGKMWRFTSVCETWASYKGKTGKAYDDNYVPKTWVESGLVEEIDDPDWVVMPGFRVVYDYNGNQLPCGNPYVFHNREMAERQVKEFDSRPWNHGERKAYIIDDIYEGKCPRPLQTYNGKTVYNFDWWFGEIGEDGDYVDEEIADWFLNCVPYKTWTRNMIQCGEPYSSTKEGMTYSTFIKIADGVWEYKGNCLKGTTDHGTPIPYM